MKKIIIPVVLASLCLGLFLLIFKSKTPVTTQELASDMDNSISSKNIADNNEISSSDFASLDRMGQQENGKSSANSNTAEQSESTQSSNPKTVESQDEFTDLLDSEVEAEAEQTLVESPVNLWEQNTSAELDSGADQRIEHMEPIKANPRAISDLRVGQTLDFYVPQNGRSYESLIESTSNQADDIKIWTGMIRDDRENSNVLITQGKVMTHIVLSTADGVYSAQFDNKTGEGTVVDEREYTSRANQDDAIPFDPQSESIPNSSE